MALVIGGAAAAGILLSTYASYINYRIGNCGGCGDVNKGLRKENQ